MTTPDPETPAPDETPIQRFRMPLEAWTAFGRVCHWRRIPRARRLFELMWADVRRYGSDEDKAAFAAADEQLKARRSRKPDESPAS